MLASTTVSTTTECVVFAFPTRSRCPACRSVNTVADTTRGPIQYRKCRDCGRRYHTRGEKI